MHLAPPDHLDPWRPEPAAIEAAQRGHPGYLYDEAGVPTYELPPLFAPGSPANRDTWDARRRQELLRLFERHVYGRSPQPPAPDRVRITTTHTDPAAMNGRAKLDRVDITINPPVATSEAEHRSITIRLILWTPNGRPSPVPAFLLIANRGPESFIPSRKEKSGYFPAEHIIDRGYAAAVFFNADVAPDHKAGHLAGVHDLYRSHIESQSYKWGTLAAWSWGASRVLDALELDARIDAARVAVVGHSRGGKAALWAAATDPRFAMAVANQSGCGGAALFRRRFGETIQRINAAFPHWFCDHFQTYDDRENDLPIDQHQLLALIAPRRIYVASAADDLWADPRGEYLALHHAGDAYALYGHKPLPQAMPPLDHPLASGPMAYHVRSGKHDLTEQDWSRFIDFADATWTTEASR